MNQWSDLLQRQYGDASKPKGVVGRPPTLSPEQCKDVIDLVGERIKAEDEIKKLELEIKKRKERVRDLMDRKAALTNTQIGRVFNVSHNVIREIVLGKYRWTRVDSGHDE